MNLIQHPTIEKRKSGKNKTRFYVVGVPGFGGAQKYGFKSESSLMKCYTWWFNNCSKKRVKARDAKKEWKSGGRQEFYDKQEFAYQI